MAGEGGWGENAQWDKNAVHIVLRGTVHFDNRRRYLGLRMMVELTTKMHS